LSSVPFPSLRIERDALVPQGAFARAQAEFLHPDPQAVSRLQGLLRDTNAGVVAHFYMDAELQGVLAACQWPHVHISDSLQMADRAVEMARLGVRTVLVAGVDFMTENVRAVLDGAGFALGGPQPVDVFRLAPDAIGCSLAEAAEALAYGAFLQEAARTPRSLHVVYINTSLRVKAHAHRLVPTITCTSSNVVQTILQAAAQVDDLQVWYGPDTYMGENLVTLFNAYAQLSAAEVSALHPAHSPASISSLLQRFHPFQQGVCIVHHLFGAEVTEQVRRDYPHAFYTAHLEVPGEMFALAAEAQREGRGAVGSTSNILGFILEQVRLAAAKPGPCTLQVVLGTEAGMVTAIVGGVQAALRQADRADVAVEIIFPVAAEAVAQMPDSELQIVPGVAAGEGCSTAGGCATCPYMKKNHLDALLDVLASVGRANLDAFRPRMDPRRIGGRTVAELGAIPILHMRTFQRTGRLPDDLVQDILARGHSLIEPHQLAAWPSLPA
jgi:quinolinate synthase